MLSDYAAAVEAHTAAFYTFQEIRVAYHARQIGDAEFLAAMAIKAEADAAYDAAFERERNIELDRIAAETVEAVEPVEDDRQIALL